MNELIALKKHSSLLSSPQVKQICAPVLTKIGIEYFTFVRQFKNRSRICLTTEPIWHEHFCTTKRYLTDKFELPFGSFSNGYFLWTVLKDTAVYNDALENFKISHGLTLVDPHTTHCDFYHFGAHADRQLHDSVYITHLTSLQSFVFYFLDKAQDLIRASEIIAFPEWDREVDSSPQQKPASKSILFSGDHEIKRFHLGEKFGEEYLTTREVEFLHWVIHGKTTWEISKILNISERTAEEYSKHIRGKLGCANIQQAIGRLGKSMLMSLLLSNSSFASDE